MPKSDVQAVFIQRLKQARKALGLSQTALGLEIGLTEEVASTRINRYELGKSEPDLRTAEAMAGALGVPLSWLVCTDPKLAAMIEGFAKLPPKAQDTLLALVETALAKTKTPYTTPAKRAQVKAKSTKSTEPKRSGPKPPAELPSKASPKGRTRAR